MKFVQQKTENGCVVACVAMVSGKTFNEIHQQVGYKESPISALEEAALLAKNGLVAVRQPFNNVFSDSAVYLATVPSLNELGMNHSVVFLVDENWSLTVLDPQKGREGQLYYTSNEPMSEAERFMTSWSELTRVHKVQDLIQLPIRPTSGVVNQHVH